MVGKYGRWEQYQFRKIIVETFQVTACNVEGNIEDTFHLWSTYIYISVENHKKNCRHERWQLICVNCDHLISMVNKMYVNCGNFIIRW